MSLKQLADRYIHTMKLDAQLLDITEQQYEGLFRLWKDHSPNSPLIKNLPCGVHGFLRTDADGAVITAGVNAKDPFTRQRLAVVHEGIHAVFGGPSTQPSHRDLHVLAGGLAHSIFPSKTNSQHAIMFDADEMDILRRLQGDVDDVFDDDFDDDFDAEGVVLADDDQYFLKGLRRKLKRRKSRMRARKALNPSAGANYVTNRLPPSVNVDNAAAAKILSQYRGWATPFLIKMFETGQVLLPTRGIYRVNNYSEWSGWSHGSLEDFWRSVTAGLDSTSLSKTAKIDSTRLITTDDTALAASVPTSCFPVVALSGSVRVIGCIVRIAIPAFPTQSLVTTGETLRVINPPTVANFSVFAESATRRRHFAIGLDQNAGGTTAEFLVLMTENDRGAATVVGQDLSTPIRMVFGIVAGSGGAGGAAYTKEPTAAYTTAYAAGVTDLNSILSTIQPSAATTVGATESTLPQLAGCTVTIESLNLRDLVGDSVRR